MTEEERLEALEKENKEQKKIIDKLKKKVKTDSLGNII
jgi:uncharacterized coiled-coil protein SlyX